MACCHATRTGRADLLKSIETRSVVILVGLEITFISMYLLELIELYSYSKGYWALLDFFLLQLIYLAYFANDQRKTMAVLYAVLAVVVFAGFASTCAVAVLVEYQNFLIELKIFFNFVSLVLAGMLALVFFYPQETWYSQRFRENLKDNEAMSEYTIVDTDREKPGASSEAVNFYYLFGCSWIMAILVFFASLHSMYIAYLAYSYNVPDSEFVTVQGMSIRFNCGGTGSPTVVLLHGLGGRSLDYSWLQPELEKETRVCSYDRPGYGDSFQRGPLPRTAERSAVELEGILTELEITGDFIVVAHSFGTWVTREYDAKFPGRIQGALFLDPVNENNYPDCDPNVAYLPPDYLTPMFLAALFLSDSGVIELIDWSGILDGSWDVDLLPPDARGRRIDVVLY